MSTDVTLARITAARAALILDQPFFGVLALQLKIVLDATCNTAWTDGRSLGFNPAFVATLTQEQLIGLICHEVLHCACGHPWRRDGREFQQWNQACDYAINPIVADAGMKLPADVLLDARYSGKHAEWIFDRIGEGKGEDEPGEGKGEGEGEPGEDTSQDGSGEPQDNDQDGNGKGEGKGEGDAEGDSNGDAEGDGTGSDQPSNAQGKGNPQGEVRDAPADVPGEDGLTEGDWKEIEVQARKLAKGSLSQGAQRGLEAQATPIVDWRAALRRFMQAVSASDYSWTRPNTRYLAHGLYLPALRAEAMGSIVVAIDTSGSIDDVLLKQFAEELQTIVEELKPERVHVVYCDSLVRGTAEFEPGDAIVLDPKGGGGTDFVPAFQWVESEGIQPVALVYFTDLDGDFPANEPAYPVLWAATRYRDQPVPFGDIVPID